MAKCPLEIETVAGCRRDANDVPLESVTIHYEYGRAAGGATILVSTRYTNADGVAISLGGGETVSVGVCEIIPLDASKEFAVQLSPSVPTISIDPGMLGDVQYDSVSISNLSAYDGVGPAQGDYRPFRGQDPQNTTVLWAEIEFVQANGNTFSAWHMVPPGTKIIQMNDASIRSVPRLAIVNDLNGDTAGPGVLEVKALNNGLPPSIPVYAAVTFNRSNKL